MLSELETRAHELRANRETFTAFLRGLDEAQLNQSSASEEYSPRQVLAHLVGADMSMLRMAKNWIAERDNRLRADFDRDFFNRRQQEKRAAQSLDDLLIDWEKSQRELIALFETITPEDLEKRGDHPQEANTTLARLFSIISTHEADHIRQVMETHNA